MPAFLKEPKTLVSYAAKYPLQQKKKAWIKITVAHKMQTSCIVGPVLHKTK
jgi:hypothetical protein